jgi:thioesterase domain-containing protein
MAMMYMIVGDTVVVTVERPTGGHTVSYVSPRYMRTWLGGEEHWVVVEVDARWREWRNYTDVWEVKGKHGNDSRGGTI